MKRVLALVAVVFMVVSCMITPAAAWNAESFVNGSVYEYESVADTPMLMSLDDGVSVVSETDSDLYVFMENLPTVSSSLPKLGVKHTLIVDVPATGYHSETDIVTAEDVGAAWAPQFFANGTLSLMSLCSYTIPDNTSSLDYSDTYVQWPVYLASDSDPYVQLDYDVSALSASTVYFSGTICCGAQARFSSYLWCNASHFDLLINGNTVQSFYSASGEFDLGGFYFDSTDPIQTVSFVFAFSDPITVSGLNPGDVIDRLTLSINANSTVSMSVLTENAALDGFNDAAQDKINEHEAYESEWTGSMMENFNALDLSGFTYPDGLVSAFALITGIFNDLWNGMGDYKILYVFPLTLGVVLLLIGRISKFSGRGSTSRSGKGDDSA